jgi:prolyl-tRNA synthetase
MHELGHDTTAAGTLKNVVLRTHAPGADGWELLVIGVPGDREVDLKRIGGQLEPVVVEQAGPDDLATQPGLVKGYIGPQVLSDLKVRYLVDPLVVEGSAWVTGANAEGRHAANAVRGRDFTPDGEIGAVEIRDGDRCARCGSPLEIARGIELGHVFQLGQKYAKTFGLTALDQNGKPVTVTMGSYGVGVTRAVAALAEQTFDDKGLCWPRSVAPADVHIVATGKDDTVFDAAERIAADLEAAGVGVMYDDRRGVSPGVKFKDAELIGVPTIVIVGKNLADGVVELRDRRTDERQDVPVDGAAAVIAAAVRG